MDGGLTTHQDSTLTRVAGQQSVHVQCERSEGGGWMAPPLTRVPRQQTVHIQRAVVNGDPKISVAAWVACFIPGGVRHALVTEAWHFAHVLYADALAPPGGEVLPDARLQVRVQATASIRKKEFNLR